MPSDNPDQNDAAETQAYVWDLPTRLFHWSLVLCVTTSLFAGEFGYMDIHLISGHVLLALILFRLLWGFVGGRHARFADFVKGPFTVLRYALGLLKGPPKAHLGHNPMGGWSVMALIGTLMFQVGTGLFSNDDILTEGPLAETVSKSTSDYLTYLHEQSGYVLYGLIGLHLAAVAFYTLKGHPIIGAMITGNALVEQEKAADRDAASGANLRGSLTLAIFIILVTAAIAYAIKTY